MASEITYNIAIVGAGPGGCTLARILLVLSKSLPPTAPALNITIFESEGSINERSQGGTLDLHQKTGLAAIAAADLQQEFEARCRYDGEAICFADKDFNCFVRMKGSEGKEGSNGRPEIDRRVLREMLYDSLPDGMVRWNHRLRRVEEDPTSTVKTTLHFDNGAVESGFDIIVGAEGCWSKIRALLTDTQPHFSGMTGHEFRIPDVRNTHPDIWARVQGGMMMTISDGQSLGGQQIGNGELKVSTWFRVTDGPEWKDTCGYDTTKPREIHAAMLNQFKDWAPELLAMLEAANPDSALTRDLYMFPVGFKFAGRNGITTLGDAAHVTLPFAGEGVNIAMTDSLRLANAIIDVVKTTSSSSSSSPSTLNISTALRTYEDDMFQRAAKVQRLTWGNTEDFYLKPGGPRATIEQFLIRIVAEEMGWWAKVPAAIFAYTYFFFWRLLHPVKTKQA